MKLTISATELARKLGDVLSRVRYRGDSFIVERNGTAVARIEPAPGGKTCSLHEAFGAWTAAGEPDSSFADDLEAVGTLDRPPADPWDS